MKRVWFLILVMGWPALLFGIESMPQMPKLKAKRVYTVPNPEAGEALEAQRGFGDQADEVQMMNLMMVGGSGYEEMEMTPDSGAKSHQNHHHHSEHPSSHH